MLIPVLVSAAHILREGESTRLSVVRESYLKKCARHRLLPLIVSPDMSKESVLELYRLSSGVLFLGGADIEPSLYGRKKHPETHPPELERDHLEIALFRRAFSDRKPFLGICRGAQLMAVASGGTLVQHLPDITDENHNSTYEGLKSGKKHSVTISPDTRLAQIVGKENGSVNSAHHQAVEDIPETLRVSARSSAGVIEAIEARNHFCIGLQSHPEMEEDGIYEPVFAAFREAALAFRSELQR
jgi:putative glutamine amidotransferase